MGLLKILKRRYRLKYDKGPYIVEYSIRFYGDFMKENLDFFPVLACDKL